MRNYIIIFLIVICFSLMGYICYINIDKFVTVEIKDGVVNPGVYKLKRGSVVNDLIIKSGGLVEGYSIELINLSKVLDDEMVVILYKDSEVKDSFVYVDYECICPSVSNDGLIDTFIDNDIVPSELISINNALVSDLIKLPGIGEAKAKKIIEYRENNGLFKNKKDIMNVSGIGSAMYEKIKDYITV